MPKIVEPGQQKRSKTLRISPGGIAWIEQRADEEGVVDSELIRLALAYAQRHMPKGWRP